MAGAFREAEEVAPPPGRDDGGPFLIVGDAKVLHPGSACQKQQAMESHLAAAVSQAPALVDPLHCSDPLLEEVARAAARLGSMGASSEETRSQGSDSQVGQAS